MDPRQTALFPKEEDRVKTTTRTSTTFADNRKLPIHRWFRYSAGFSALWVQDVIESRQGGGRVAVFDPFTGSGTVQLAAERCGVESIGLEPHPFVWRIAKAKLAWRVPSADLQLAGEEILGRAQSYEIRELQYPPLVRKCFPDASLARLDALRRAWLETPLSDSLHDLIWLALASILRESSPVGTAQWQYVLPNKSKSGVSDPFFAFARKVAIMCEDMRIRQGEPNGPGAKVLQADARECAGVPDAWASLIITSPPYANNFDYADATRLEMTFFGEVERWRDLQTVVRSHLMRSCTQHVTSIVDETDGMVGDPLLLPIRDELREVVRKLEVERENHAGMKSYHTMIAAYFLDLAQVWRSLRRVCQAGAAVCFVIGDSAPYGVYVPVDRWLGELAVAAGFKEYRFEKTRDRNVKWKNRKHRVPLHEGRLWVEG